MVTLKIDGRTITVPEGTTILKAARSAGIEIPSLCYIEGINEIAACRVCVVEVEGLDRLLPSCSTAALEDMTVYTNSPRVRSARRTNIELLLSQHDCRCALCIRSGNCELQKLANDLNIVEQEYETELSSLPLDKTVPFIKNADKCIKCMRCVQVCDKVQGMNIWDVYGTGGRTSVDIAAASLRETDCTFCGQCVTHCPTGALFERDDTRTVMAALADPEIITVVQVAPAVRVAWAEQLGLTDEEATTGKLVSALKEVGFNYVFDTNFAADLTIMEEGTEFLQRFMNRDDYKWPMFTSCCPGWVRFVKTQYPGYEQNLSTAKSPQQMFGAIAKSYFAEKAGIDPHKLFVVSIMPCVAKKNEAELPGMDSACGDRDVDAVLTTRELARILKADHLSVGKLEEKEFDSPLGSGTGAAVVFGATGGVMDAALRSAYYLVTGENPNADSFDAVRGLDGWKEAVITIPGAGEVKVAVVSGLRNTRRLMKAIDEGKAEYDFVEVMACPGGCAGGGGQPIHEAEEFAECRGENLWRLDRDAKFRYSHENPDVVALYTEYLEEPLSQKSHELLHTHGMHVENSGEHINVCAAVGKRH